MSDIETPETQPESIVKMEATIKRYHADQFRNNGKSPYWLHCVNVKDLLRQTLDETGEIGDENLSLNMQLAAMGHDLLEDTEITRETISEEFGRDVLDLIEHLTNENGDFDRQAYLEKMRSAPEEAKLIKLADMTENCDSVADGINDLGTEWATNFFLPIIDEMQRQIKPEDFKKYKVTASRLREKFDIAYRKLHNIIDQHNQ